MDEAWQDATWRQFGAALAGLLLYNMRHVQHGVAQLNLVLRQAGHAPPRWVAVAGEDGATAGGDGQCR